MNRGVTPNTPELPGRPPASSKERFWDGDSVEIWMDTDQFGAGIADGKPFVVCHNRADAAAGAKAAVRQTDTGWHCEIALLRAQLAVSAQRGKNTPLAVGVNDADGAPKRKHQVYFPSS